MIQPINKNLNISASNNLKPVEVPHFTGFTKVRKEDGDSFRTAIGNTSDRTKKAAKTGGNSTFTTKLKKNALETFDTAKAGTKEGVKVVKDVTKKSIEFTGSFVKSLYEDLSQAIKEKGVKTAATINDIV